MKNIYKVLPLALLVLSAGCRKKLDKEPLGVTTDVNFYKSNDDMVQAVNAAYDPLGWESADNTNIVFFNYFFGDIASDDANIGGDGNEPRVYPYAFFTVNSTDQGLLNLWRKYYIGIYRCNLVITKAPESEASTAIKNRVTGEAKFLRAYYYFKLVQMFGDVPLVTKLLTPEEYKQPRTPKATVYAQIEADLLDAANLLPEKGQIETGRATRGAANGLLARVYLFQNKWNDVITAGNKVVASGKYSLEPDYRRIFTLAAENGPESIFEIQSTSVGTGDERLNEGTFINKYYGPRGALDGNFGVGVPSEELVNEFKQDSALWKKMDPRKRATILMDGDTVGNTVINVSTTPWKYYNRKYAQEGALNPQTNGPTNQRIIRYSDVLLMLSEAYARIGDNANALKHVDSVRSRVKMPLLSSDPTYTGDKLLQAILKERRLELALEGHRFFDLVRQGRAAEKIKATAEGQRFQAGKNELWPIPQSEIDLSEGLIIQNPGY